MSAVIDISKYLTRSTLEFRFDTKRYAAMFENKATINLLYYWNVVLSAIMKLTISDLYEKWIKWEKVVANAVFSNTILRYLQLDIIEQSFV